jgi:alpha-D-ribose 1-methylphosphonate 5-triphosphate synthase subunit PhnG
MYGKGMDVCGRAVVDVAARLGGDGMELVRGWMGLDRCTVHIVYGAERIGW